jgi:hypothetical protein
LSGIQLIIPDDWLAGLPVFQAALRMTSRCCLLCSIAVFALAILLFAMAAASGSSAQVASDNLLIDTDTVVAFGSISGEAISTLDVGTTPEGTVWFHAAAALQFARGFVNPEHAKKLLSKMLLEDCVPDWFQRGWWKVGSAKCQIKLDCGTASSPHCVLWSRPICCSIVRSLCIGREISTLQSGAAVVVEAATAPLVSTRPPASSRLRRCCSLCTNFRKCVCVCLLLQDLVQRCLHGGGGDMGGHVLRETTIRGVWTSLPITH